jgi:DNA-binding NtrC family response regulator
VLNVGPIIQQVDLTDDTYGNSLPASESDLSKPLKRWLVQKEKQYIAQKLNDLGGNVGLTAKSCRIGVRTLSRKMQQYGLDKAAFKQKDSPGELRRP